MNARFFFYALAFSAAGRGVEALRHRSCIDEADAVNTAARLAERHPGAIAMKIEGDALGGVWSDPERLAEFGSVMTKRA